MERMSILEDFQVTWSVISEFESSVKIPVALKLSLSPFATEAFTGETEIETKAAGVTLMFIEPAILPIEAETVIIPVSNVSNIPLSLTEAVVESEEFQITEDEMSLFELSEYIPVAVS